MGKVYKGHLIGQSGFQRPIVIKQLRHSDDPGHVKLFVEEARRYAVLDHENIGRIFDFEMVDGQLCIIFEYIDGWTLIEYLERHKDLSSLPDIEFSVFIASRVCRALQYVFERSAIVHRDISPSNIMMTREGTVKLIDFGIATRSGTRDSSLTGKPAYMAPEMVVELKADNRSDVFSLGAVLFEMLTLNRLFQGDTTARVLEQVVAGHHASPRAYNANIPDDVMALLRTALQRDPGKRFASAGAMGQACEHFLYDKGYGPTNLSLKEYLCTLFPGAGDIPSDDLEPDFPAVEKDLLPISDGLTPTRNRHDDPNSTPVAPLVRPDGPPAEAALASEVAPEAALPRQPPPETLAPTTVRPRRLKARTRPRK